jgi:hydroxypyruvate isomerase
MLKYSLCIEPVFPEVDFYERIELAAGLGFDAVEFWDPAGKDLSSIAMLAARNRIEIATCCALDAWGKHMSAPVEVVTANIRASVRVALDLGCSSLIVLSGPVEDNLVAQKVRLIDNLKRAGEIAAREEVTLNLEALNSLVDHPGYYLDSANLGFEVLRQVGNPHVKLLYDVYHMQVMQGNIIATIIEHVDAIGHFHSAGVPKRHELYVGELNYRSIVKVIEAAGYKGYFGLEYWPTYADHQQSLADVMKYLRA